MKTFPEVGDVLVVYKHLYTGEPDFTMGNEQAPGTICTVLYANKYANYCNDGIVLILLFAGGVINWMITWVTWSNYLSIHDVKDG